jgi:hypothetical protein
VQELRLYATQKLVRATSLLHLPMIDKRILPPPQSQETRENAAWLQVTAGAETKRCASVLKFQAAYELEMANEYERKQQGSVLYGLSKTRKRNSIATLPSFQEQIAAKTNLFGGEKAYTPWKKEAWRMYVGEESPVDPSSSEPFSPLLYCPLKPVSNVGTPSLSPSATTRSLKRQGLSFQAVGVVGVVARWRKIPHVSIVPSSFAIKSSSDRHFDPQLPNPSKSPPHSLPGASTAIGTSPTEASRANGVNSLVC